MKFITWNTEMDVFEVYKMNVAGYDHNRISIPEQRSESMLCCLLSVEPVLQSTHQKIVNISYNEFKRGSVSYQLASLSWISSEPPQHRLIQYSCTHRTPQCVPPCACWHSHRAILKLVTVFAGIWKSSSAKENRRLGLGKHRHVQKSSTTTPNFTITTTWNRK